MLWGTCVSEFSGSPLEDANRTSCTISNRRVRGWRLDLICYGDRDVSIALNNRNGTFKLLKLVFKDFGCWTNCMNDLNKVCVLLFVGKNDIAGCHAWAPQRDFVDILITIILNLHTSRISRLLAFWIWEHKQSSPVWAGYWIVFHLYMHMWVWLNFFSCRFPYF
jgi:hypothetical protein